MKNRKCPYKGNLCWDYGACENCEWGKLIDKYERKIKRLQSQVLEEKEETKQTTRECLRIVYNIGCNYVTNDFDIGWNNAIKKVYRKISQKYGITEGEE